MTREEAITLMKSAQLMLVNPKTNEPISNLYEALDIAIKALEKENKPRFILHSDGKFEQINVLDKITVELKSVKEKWWYGVDNDCFMKLSDVLQIIDKYKTESEAAE